MYWYFLFQCSHSFIWVYPLAYVKSYQMRESSQRSYNSIASNCFDLRRWRIHPLSVRNDGDLKKWTEIRCELTTWIVPPWAPIVAPLRRQERQGNQLRTVSVLFVIPFTWRETWDRRRTLMTFSASSTGSELKGSTLRTWSAQTSFCWHGTLAVLMMRRWGSMRKKARILRWPGLVGSESLKGATRWWMVC